MSVYNKRSQEIQEVLDNPDLWIEHHLDPGREEYDPQYATLSSLASFLIQNHKDAELRAYRDWCVSHSLPENSPFTQYFFRTVLPVLEDLPEKDSDTDERLSALRISIVLLQEEVALLEGKIKELKGSTLVQIACESTAGG